MHRPCARLHVPVSTGESRAFLFKVRHGCVTGKVHAGDYAAASMSIDAVNVVGCIVDVVMPGFFKISCAC